VTACFFFVSVGPAHVVTNSWGLGQQKCTLVGRPQSYAHAIPKAW